MSLLISASTSSLKPFLKHQFDLFLPRLLLLEPWIFGNLLGPFDIGILQVDLHARRQLAAYEILAAQSDVASIGNGHPFGFVGQIDRSLLDHAVDVVSPGIVIEQAIDGQIQFIVQAIQQASHAARRLPATVRQDTVIVSPELVFVEPAPDRIFFHMQDEFGADVS